MTAQPIAQTVSELNERSREILRHIVESYVQSGEPIGSRTLSRRREMAVRAAVG